MISSRALSDLIYAWRALSLFKGFIEVRSHLEVISSSFAIIFYFSEGCSSETSIFNIRFFLKFIIFCNLFLFDVDFINVTWEKVTYVFNNSNDTYSRSLQFFVKWIEYKVSSCVTINFFITHTMYANYIHEQKYSSYFLITYTPIIYVKYNICKNKSIVPVGRLVWKLFSGDN